jgi:hypothetical protein
MKWVTRSHIHMDRAACPWLITRFINSQAEFLFVPSACVEEVVKRENAIPFDVPGVELGHGQGTCSFDAFLHKYALKDKALLRLAKIVNAADLHKLNDDPIAAGLDAIATGFGIRFPDDRENLRQQLAVYDALYAWCRLEVAKDGK